MRIVFGTSHDVGRTVAITFAIATAELSVAVLHQAHAKPCGNLRPYSYDKVDRRRVDASQHTFFYHNRVRNITYSQAGCNIVTFQLLLTTCVLQTFGSFFHTNGDKWWNSSIDQRGIPENQSIRCSWAKFAYACLKLWLSRLLQTVS